ncbi:MAG: hypothetical protein IPP88_20145 [Betaproteobacteria bacterium]|nr:hypothetical protein [Betaproteobacteria bacterium]
MVQMPAVSIVTLRPDIEHTVEVVDERATVRPEFEVGVGSVNGLVALKRRSAMGLKAIAWLAF